MSIPHSDALAKLPEHELQDSLHRFLEPATVLLPDPRLRAVAELITQGIVTSQSPIVTQIARGADHSEDTVWPTCKRAYRFLANEHFSLRTLLNGMYRIAQAAVAAQAPEYLVVAIDPVNFEKPYTRALAGVSTVRKGTMGRPTVPAGFSGGNNGRTSSHTSSGIRRRVAKRRWRRTCFLIFSRRVRRFRCGVDLRRGRPSLVLG